MQRPKNSVRMPSRSLAQAKVHGVESVLKVMPLTGSTDAVHGEIAKHLEKFKTDQVLRKANQSADAFSSAAVPTVWVQQALTALLTALRSVSVATKTVSSKERSA